MCQNYCGPRYNKRKYMYVCMCKYYWAWVYMVMNQRPKAHPILVFKKEENTNEPNMAQWPKKKNPISKDYCCLFFILAFHFCWCKL